MSWRTAHDQLGYCIAAKEELGLASIGFLVALCEMRDGLVDIHDRGVSTTTTTIAIDIPFLTKLSLQSVFVLDTVNYMHIPSIILKMGDFCIDPEISQVCAALVVSHGRPAL
jgi:hypothetical protein